MGRQKPSKVEINAKKTVKQNKLVKDEKQSYYSSPNHVYFVVEISSAFDGVTTRSRIRATKSIQRNKREKSPPTEDETNQDYLDYLDELMNQPESSTIRS